MMSSRAGGWDRFAKIDHGSTLLVNTAGKPVTFDELERENGDRFAEQARPDHLLRQWEQTRASVERLKQDLVEAAADVVVVIGDDQMEMMDWGNMQSLAVFWGDELISASPRGRAGRYGQGIDMSDVFAGMGMDANHRWPGHRPLALHFISGLIERRFDVGAMREVTDAAVGGIGHAFGTIEVNLMGEDKLPLVPVFVNNYWPPNQLPPARCYELGTALRWLIDSFPEDLRVALVASGGLSHFVTDEELDQMVLDALRAGDREALVNLPLHRLNSGSSEIRNWVALAAACHDMGIAWDDYIPVYRTAAGTGCGLTFARWSA
jgi:3-O-methylgallate 3,4-dioxygenase